MKSSSPKLWVFCKEMLRIGSVGFGGPLVTLNLMKEAFVDKLQWVSEKDFLARLGIFKLLPGPISSHMAVALGRSFFGWKLSFLAPLCFLAPPFVFILLWVHIEDWVVATFSLGLRENFLWVFKIYISAAIAVASFKLLKDAWKSFPLRARSRAVLFFFILTFSFMLSFKHFTEIQIIFCSVLISFFCYRYWPKRERLYSLSVLAVGGVFLTASFLVFGTGYVLFPYVERELVATGLLSYADFQKGILLGNLSPGPVVIAATFYGWKLASYGGAILATLGIFAGPFILINLLYPTIEKLREFKLIQYLSLSIVPALVIVLFVFNWGFFSQGGLGYDRLAIFILFAYVNYRYAFRWQLLFSLLLIFAKSAT